MSTTAKTVILGAIVLMAGWGHRLVGCVDALVKSLGWRAYRAFGGPLELAIIWPCTLHDSRSKNASKVV